MSNDLTHIIAEALHEWGAKKDNFRGGADVPDPGWLQDYIAAALRADLPTTLAALGLTECGIDDRCLTDGGFQPNQMCNPTCDIRQVRKFEYVE